MQSPDLTRRQFLERLATAGALVVTPARLLRAAEPIRFKDDPFTLGVASGYPGPDGIVLWTRLATAPLEPRGGMPQSIIPVQWEISADEAFRRIVQTGTAYADPEWGHSVHVEITGLESSRPYWYRFVCGGARSPAGRTCTAPTRGDSLNRLRLAVASCQQYEHGYYAAYRHMCTMNSTPSCTSATTSTNSAGALSAYGVMDHRSATRWTTIGRGMRCIAAIATCRLRTPPIPWLVTWDDHEVDNDYANDVSEQDDEPEAVPGPSRVRVQAYYEHMPLPTAGRAIRART